jgi:hypothetical protein
VEGGEEEGVEGDGRDGDLMRLEVSWSHSLPAVVARCDYEGALEHERRLELSLSAVSSVLCDLL